MLSHILSSSDLVCPTQARTTPPSQLVTYFKMSLLVLKYDKSFIVCETNSLGDELITHYFSLFSFHDLWNIYIFSVQIRIPILVFLITGYSLFGSFKYYFVSFMSFFYVLIVFTLISRKLLSRTLCFRCF